MGSGQAQIALNQSSTPSICSAIIFCVHSAQHFRSPRTEPSLASSAWHRAGAHNCVGLSRGVQEELVQKKKGPEGVGGTEQVRRGLGARDGRRV